MDTLKKASGVPIDNRASKLVAKINELYGGQYWQLAIRKSGLRVESPSSVEEKVTTEKHNKEEVEVVDLEGNMTPRHDSELSSFIPLSAPTSQTPSILEDLLKEKDDRLLKDYIFQVFFKSSFVPF